MSTRDKFIMNLHLYYVQVLIPVILLDTGLSHTPLHGRYTKDIHNYQLTIPRKLNYGGDFVSFDIPHYFEHNFGKRTRKRSVDDPNAVHYGIVFNGAKHHLELWPNHALVAPNVVFEVREPNRPVKRRTMRGLEEKKLCHYTGRIRNVPGSRAAISTCDGLAGYVSLDGRTYFIEPLNDHVPNNEKQHVHVVHNKGVENEPSPSYKTCGTTSKWQVAWKERFRKRYMGTDEIPVNVGTRGMQSRHRYLETLIVCDKQFLEYHKNTDYETYVLTIMNMVADYYHDASSGNQMDVVVIRVMYLEKEEEEIDLVINPNADDTLASFCKWQQMINPKDIGSPHHHDIAVLLTRHDICAENLTQCGLMGLAYVAAACTGDKPCAINEDGGLVLGIVVAHEMGHVMGCAHDKEEESGCKSQDENKSYYIMAPYVHLDTTRWSTCSKNYITALFDNNLGECLNDEPAVTRYQYPNMLPGAIYDALYQCRMEFPNSMGICGKGDQLCNELSCQVSETECMMNGEPAADGTRCGENKWCYKRKCVEIGERPAAINGGWGPWGSFTACSRTCGGGVSYSERECNNPVPQHKGRYCIGDRKQIKICNTQPCPEGSKSFRAVQCSEHDNKPFDGKLHTWVTYMKEDDPCSLYCLNNDRVYVKLEAAVKDGTRCKAGTKYMCISGICTKVGCDYVLHSDAVEDDCGVCKGDGTQCKMVEATYREKPGRGYVAIATVPKGSRNIAVEELKESENTIAVSDETKKKFFLNGDFGEQQNGDHEIGGATGVYSHPEPQRENLVIYGPLKESVILYVVFYANENVGYHYKYSEPVAESTYQPHYHWEFVEWGECSVRCGGGVETAEPDCLEDKAGKVTPSYCDVVQKPEPMKRKCNEQPCKTKWRVGKWGKCSACKFQSGVRTREVECVREAPVPGTDDVLVDDKDCTGPRPGTRELCNSHKKCSKTRRNFDNLPDEIMQHLWFQSLNDRLLEKIYESQRLSRAPKEPTCEQGKENVPKQNITLKVGSIVVDKDPAEEVKLIVVPLKQSHLSLNISDNAFETVGDKVGDTVDPKSEKVFKGKEAIQKIKEIQHGNITNCLD